MTKLLLHEFHQARGAQFLPSDNAEAVESYRGDVPAEHRALTESAGVLDLSFRSRICLTGADRVRFLHGQVTNDIKGLRVGRGCYAALITAKGKMTSDLDVFCLADELLLDFEPGLTATVSERLEKYVIADDVQMVDVAPNYGLLAVEGPKAYEVARMAGVASALPEDGFSFVAIELGEAGILYVANNPRLGSKGFDLFAPNAFMPQLAEKLVDAVNKVGGRICGMNAFEIARIEAGIPRFGIDMDETNLPLEAGLENNGISFTKGCYIGQEVISRIRTYGQVAKALRVLRLGGAGDCLPQKGDKIFKDAKDAGYVTSAVASPKSGAKVALGYVRKEVNQIGTDLVVQAADGNIPATISGLPFGTEQFVSA